MAGVFGDCSARIEFVINIDEGPFINNGSEHIWKILQRELLIFFHFLGSFFFPCSATIDHHPPHSLVRDRVVVGGWRPSIHRLLLLLSVCPEEMSTLIIIRSQYSYLLAPLLVCVPWEYNHP